VGADGFRVATLERRSELPGLWGNDGAGGDTQFPSLPEGDHPLSNPRLNGGAVADGRS